MKVESTPPTQITTQNESKTDLKSKTSTAMVCAANTIVNTANILGLGIIFAYYPITTVLGIATGTAMALSSDEELPQHPDRLRTGGLYISILSRPGWSLYKPLDIGICYALAFVIGIETALIAHPYLQKAIQRLQTKNIVKLTTDKTSQTPVQKFK